MRGVSRVPDIFAAGAAVDPDVAAGALPGEGEPAPAGAFAAIAIPPVAAKNALASTAEAKWFMEVSLRKGRAHKCAPQSILRRGT